MAPEFSICHRMNDLTLDFFAEEGKIPGVLVQQILKATPNVQSLHVAGSFCEFEQPTVRPPDTVALFENLDLLGLYGTVGLYQLFNAHFIILNCI